MVVIAPRTSSSFRCSHIPLGNRSLLYYIVNIGLCWRVSIKPCLVLPTMCHNDNTTWSRQVALVGSRWFVYMTWVLRRGCRCGGSRFEWGNAISIRPLSLLCRCRLHTKLPMQEWVWDNVNCWTCTTWSTSPDFVVCSLGATNMIVKAASLLVDRHMALIHFPWSHPVWY